VLPLTFALCNRSPDAAAPFRNKIRPAVCGRGSGTARLVTTSRVRSRGGDSPKSYPPPAPRLLLLRR
jgi:hypothetical protein